MGDKGGFHERSNRGGRPSRFSEGEKPPRPGRAELAKRAERDRSPMMQPTLRIANLPADWTWRNLKDFFIAKIGEVAHVKVKEGEHRGVGIVKFDSEEACEQALREVRGCLLDGRKLFVEKVQPGEKPIKNKFESHGDHINREDQKVLKPNEKANYYGLNKAFLNAMNIKPPIPNKAFVMNLSYKVTKEKLLEIFSMAGKVHHVELFGNPDGTHKGMAVIEFDHPVEVVQAISMFHKQILYDRPIIVQVDKLSEKREYSLPEGLEGIGPGLGPQGSALRSVAYTIDKQMQKNEKEPDHVKEDQPFINPNVNMLSGNQTIWRPSGYEIIPQVGMTNQPIINNVPMNASVPMNMNQIPQVQYNQMGMNAQIPMNNHMITNQMPIANQMSAYQQAPASNDVNLGNMNAQTLMTLMNLQTQIQQQGLSVNDIPKMLVSLGGGGEPGKRRATSIDRTTDDRGRSAERRVNISDLVSISNLPPGMGPEQIHSKLGEAARVKFVDVTGPRSATVKFASGWDADKAMNHFNRTRIQGYLIEMSYR